MLTHQLRCRPVGVALLSCALTLGMVACDPEANTSPLDPKLGALASNGGPTKTPALRPGSPALDAASTADCPSTDQRGVVRPQGSVCDIGSYERQAKGGK